MQKSSLEKYDPEVYSILQSEKNRQFKGLQLIASENFTSTAVREAVGSCMIHKYSEGYPGSRYYSGNEYIDQNELLCQKRALTAFKLDFEEWGVNVQPLSGSVANFAVYNALLKPHDRIMGLDLPHGGHLTHGYMTNKKRVSATSIYFESMPYQLDRKTELIDYETLEKNAQLFKPQMIIAGSSAYPRLFDYKRMRDISDQQDAYLLADIAHVSGLIVADEIPSPFPYSDIVTTTTHKTLRGPRGALIFYRKKMIPGNKKKIYNLEERINKSVFPELQGGPHNHTIAGISVALKEACSPQFKEYQIQVRKNCQALSNKLIALGYTLTSGGSDTHMILIDLRNQCIDGARVDAVAESVGIFANKNTVPSDDKPSSPSGIRIGTPAMTTRGFKEKDFEQVAILLDQTIRIAKKINNELLTSNGNSRLSDFKEFLVRSQDKELKDLKYRVEDYCQAFPPP